MDDEPCRFHKKSPTLGPTSIRARTWRFWESWNKEPSSWHAINTKSNPRRNCRMANNVGLPASRTGIKTVNLYIKTDHSVHLKNVREMWQARTKLWCREQHLVKEKHPRLLRFSESKLSTSNAAKSHEQSDFQVQSFTTMNMEYFLDSFQSKRLQWMS